MGTYFPSYRRSSGTKWVQFRGQANLCGTYAEGRSIELGSIAPSAIYQPVFFGFQIIMLGHFITI